MVLLLDDDIFKDMAPVLFLFSRICPGLHTSTCCPGIMTHQVHIGCTDAQSVCSVFGGNVCTEWGNSDMYQRLGGKTLCPVLQP